MLSSSLALAVLLLSGLTAANTKTSNHGVATFETFPVDMTAFLNISRSGEEIDLPIGKDATVPVALTYMNLFAEPNGNRIHVQGDSWRTVDFTSWRGAVVGEPESHVVVTIAPSGFYGYVTMKGQPVITLDPVSDSESGDGRILQGARRGNHESEEFEIVARPLQVGIDTGRPSSSGAIASTGGCYALRISLAECVYSPIEFLLPVPECFMSVGSPRARVATVADQYFVAAHDDWSARIGASMAVQVDMWESQTCIFITYGLYAFACDFGPLPERCFEGQRHFCDATLVNWKTHMEVTPFAKEYTGTWDAYVLFSGLDGDDLVTGCANIGADAKKNDFPYVVMEVADGDPDFMDEASSRHRGLIMGQELAHVWGETSHPGNDAADCPENPLLLLRQFGVGLDFITSNVLPLDCRDFWFAESSKTKIRKAWGTSWF